MSVDMSLIRPELVFFDWDVATPAALFAQLARRLLRGGYVRETWLDAVSARERAYPTGLQTLAAGIALPHADAEHVARPFIAIVRPREPVSFEAMAGMGDPVPAELVIVLGLTHAADQVNALQHLMNVFMDEDRVREVMAQTSAQGMIDALSAEV